jgi:dihydrofolate reductase
MTRNGVIGRGGGLPWDLPEDRQLFRRLTEGNTVIMGRATFESLPAPLPHRHNLVLSRNPRQSAGVTVCRDFLEAIILGGQLGRPILVIGGVELYRQALPIADTLHISWVEGEFTGDRCFPPFDLAAWEAVESIAYPGFEYVVYRRRF